MNDGIAPLFWLTVIITSLWVLHDSSRLEVKRGSLNNRHIDEGPLGWFVGCLLLWIIVFPIYLIVRPKYVALQGARNSAAAGTALQTPTAGAPGHAAHGDIPAQITALSTLHASGALSDTEFQAKKTELLGRM